MSANIGAVAVVAESWIAFNWWCSENGIDPKDRTKAIPLISFTDKYRLYGRRISRVQRVGTIEEKLLNTFRTELRRYGVEI